MLDQPSARLHQPVLQARQRPALDSLWQPELPPEIPQILGQHAELQSHFIRPEAMTRQPRPVRRLLAFFNPLLLTPQGEGASWGLTSRNGKARTLRAIRMASAWRTTALPHTLSCSVQLRYTSAGQSKIMLAGSAFPSPCTQLRPNASFRGITQGCIFRAFWWPMTECLGICLSTRFPEAG